MTIKVPRYDAFSPSSASASETKRRNRKRDTKAELALFGALNVLRLRYLRHVEELPGCPDVVFAKERVVVFCDGDFWHGRDWPARRETLSRGSNAEYWTTKIGRNRERDWEQSRALMQDGWTILRLWETDVLEDPVAAALQVRSVLLEARKRRELAKH